MKNPNGYGTVAKLKGNRRKPFIVKKVTGWKDNGQPIVKIIGYTATREEGNILLAEYNKNPWDITTSQITLSELFILWNKTKLPKLKTTTGNRIKSAFKHCKKYANMKYKDIKAYHMQDCIDNCNRSYSTQGQIKNFWYHLDRLALELDIIPKGYSFLLKTDPVPETTKTRFSNEEINNIWTVYEDSRKNPQKYSPAVCEWIDSVLFLIYTGFRISEFLHLKTENVDLNIGTLKGGTKTTAGKNRIVPIHSLIFDIVKNRYCPENEYLFSNHGVECTSYFYRNFWEEIMTYLNIHKTPHECRHTFESLLDSAGANRKCIDLMMGHVSKDTGNRVYNHKTIEELKYNIELVTKR